MDKKLAQLEAIIAREQQKQKTKKQVHIITKVLDIAVPVMFIASVLLFLSIFI